MYHCYLHSLGILIIYDKNSLASFDNRLLNEKWATRPVRHWGKGSCPKEIAERDGARMSKFSAENYAYSFG